eukprot:s2049_g7.t1
MVGPFVLLDLTGQAAPRSSGAEKAQWATETHPAKVDAADLTTRAPVHLAFTSTAPPPAPAPAPATSTTAAPAAAQKVAEAVMKASENSQLPVPEELAAAAAASAAAADRPEGSLSPEAQPWEDVEKAPGLCGAKGSGVSTPILQRVKSSLKDVDCKYYGAIMAMWNSASLARDGTDVAIKVKKVVAVSADAGFTVEQQAQAGAAAAAAGLASLTTEGPSAVIAEVLRASDAAGLDLEMQTRLDLWMQIWDLGSGMAAVLETQSSQQQAALLMLLKAAVLSTTTDTATFSAEPNFHNVTGAAKLVGEQVAEAVASLDVDPQTKLQVISAAAAAAQEAEEHSSTTTSFDGVKLVVDAAQDAGIKDIGKLRKVQEEARVMTPDQQKAAARSLEAAGTGRPFASTRHGADLGCGRRKMGRQGVAFGPLAFTISSPFDSHELLKLSRVCHKAMTNGRKQALILSCEVPGEEPLPGARYNAEKLSKFFRRANVPTGCFYGARLTLDRAKEDIKHFFSIESDLHILYGIFHGHAGSWKLSDGRLLGLHDILEQWDLAKQQGTAQHLLIVSDSCESGHMVKEAELLGREDIAVQASCAGSNDSLDTKGETFTEYLLWNLLGRDTDTRNDRGKRLCSIEPALLCVLAPCYYCQARSNYEGWIFIDENGADQSPSHCLGSDSSEDAPLAWNDEQVGAEFFHEFVANAGPSWLLRTSRGLVTHANTVEKVSEVVKAAAAAGRPTAAGRMSEEQQASAAATAVVAASPVRDGEFLMCLTQCTCIHKPWRWMFLVNDKPVSCCFLQEGLKEGIPMFSQHFC